MLLSTCRLSAVRVRARGAALVIGLTGAISAQPASAQQAALSPPPDNGAARTQWEFSHLLEVLQEARSGLKQRRDLLGEAPKDVQVLLQKAQQSVDALLAAGQARNLPRARHAFAAALAIYGEIRLRLDDLLAARNATPLLDAPTQADRAVQGLRARYGELAQLAARSPTASVQAALASVNERVHALETRAASTPLEDVRKEVLEIRQALQDIAIAITDAATVAP